MPADSQNISPEERTALIAKIAKSEAFIGSEALPKLLLFLLDNCNDLIPASKIEELHYGRVITEETFNPNHARERISKLKERLGKYQAQNPEDAIKVELPNADDIGGYQLRFHRLTQPISACRRFWAAHLESEKPTMVVCDPLLFFWEHDSGMMFRFMDTNIEGLSREGALAELKKVHRKEHKETLIPGHFYIDVGSVMAADMIREYFRPASIDVPMLINKQVSREWLKASPIIIGNVRTNADIKKMFGSSATERFAYRIDKARFAWINIKEPRQKEIDALKEIGTKLDADGNFLTPSEELTIGIVTRMANPTGAGVMTFISSDGTFTTKQMAAALTQESQLRAIFAQMGWRLDRPIPQTFEMMFFVRLWPGDIDDEGAEARLICGRSD